MSLTPLFPEWSDLVERASADRDCTERDSTDDDRRSRAPMLHASAPPTRLEVIAARAQRRS